MRTYTFYELKEYTVEAVNDSDAWNHYWAGDYEEAGGHTFGADHPLPFKPCCPACGASQKTLTIYSCHSCRDLVCDECFARHVIDLHHDYPARVGRSAIFPRDKALDPNRLHPTR